MECQCIRADVEHALSGSIRRAAGNFANGRAPWRKRDNPWFPEGPEEVVGGRHEREVVAIDQWLLADARRLQMRDAVTTGGDALPNRDPPDVTRFKAAAAKRVQAHRWRRRLGLRCLTVRVSDRTVRHLISTGYLSLESSEAAAYVAFALEAWISDNVT